MKTPKTYFTLFIHAPGFGSAAKPAPVIGHGSAMPRPRTNGKRERAGVAGAVQIAGEHHHLNDDRRHAGAGEKRRYRAHGERQIERPAALLRKADAAREAREVDRHDVEHREAERDEDRGDRRVEPRRRVDRSERAGREDHDQAEHAVDDRHRAAVCGAKEKAAAPLAGLRAGADDCEVDRNHRQDARREIERQPAEKDDRQDRHRSAAFEEPAALDARVGVLHELQERAAVEVAAFRRAQLEAIHEREQVAAPRRRCRNGCRGPGDAVARRAGVTMRANVVDAKLSACVGVDRRSRRHDAQHPFEIHRHRPEAHLVVAGLVAEAHAARAGRRAPASTRPAVARRSGNGARTPRAAAGCLLAPGRSTPGTTRRWARSPATDRCRRRWRIRVGSRGLSD